jgi:hypothetical protein
LIILIILIFSQSPVARKAVIVKLKKSDKSSKLSHFRNMAREKIFLGPVVTVNGRGVKVEMKLKCRG